MELGFSCWKSSCDPIVSIKILNGTQSTNPIQRPVLFLYPTIELLTEVALLLLRRLCNASTIFTE